MNCKQGDLAIIVKSFAGNEGKIVRCEEFIGEIFFSKFGWQPAWRIDRQLPTMEGLLSDIGADFALRPLRGGADLEDETSEQKKKELAQ